MFSNILSPVAIKSSAPNPVIFACLNPNPETKPEPACPVRYDSIMDRRHSDFPNQVNNVLCFPLIFKGTLNVRVSEIAASVSKVVTKQDLVLTLSDDILLVKIKSNSWNSDFRPYRHVSL
jgi:malic enzyme